MVIEQQNEIETYDSDSHKFSVINLMRIFKFSKRKNKNENANREVTKKKSFSLLRKYFNKNKHHTEEFEFGSGYGKKNINVYYFVLEVYLLTE